MKTLFRTGPQSDSSTARLDVRVDPQQSSSPRLISHYSHGRANNLNLIRAVAASLVVVTHAYGVTGHGDLEPLKRVFGISFGSWAVDIFFAVSGFLVCKSWDRDPSLGRFLWARGLRIYPALWVCVAVCSLILGPSLTTLPWQSYFKHPDLFRFVACNTTVLPKGVFTTLPGVFDEQSVNSPLWTLPYELKMYVGLLVLGYIGLLYRRAVLPAIVLGSLVGYAWGAFTGDHEGTVPQYCRFVFCFFAGAWLYLHRDRVEFRRSFAAVAVLAALSAALFGSLPWQLLTITVVTPYLSLYAALVPDGLIRYYNRIGDYSYGIYIYGTPVQLTVLNWSADKTNCWHNLWVSLCITVLLAIASWYLIESRALRLKLRRKPVSNSQDPQPTPLP